jgi:hypothetical protein
VAVSGDPNYTYVSIRGAPVTGRDQETGYSLAGAEHG